MNVFSCKQVAVRITQSADRPLTVGERAGIAFHVMMCSFCRRFKRQMEFFDRVASRWCRLAETTEWLPDVQLSNEARDRIRAALRRQTDTPSDTDAGE